MLAADDPHNPPQLHALSLYSLQLYDSFLSRIAEDSGLAVPYQTSITWQYHASAPPNRLAEHSIDPRQLAAALLAAVRATTIQLLEHTALLTHREDQRHQEQAIQLTTSHGERHTRQLILTQGAWTSSAAHPVKGQMLRVALPASLPLGEVHRDAAVYIVPRTTGPSTGTALIGATVENAGFDTSVHPAQLNDLRTLAAKLLPQLASATDAPLMESWAGLRPATLDGLPLLGAVEPGGSVFLATGHYRNGILLAPATANLIADLLEGKSASPLLKPFSPARLISSPKIADIRPVADDNAFPPLQ
jgi:glycine oxidase